MKAMLLALLPAVALAQFGMPGGVTETQVAMDYEPVVYAVGAVNAQMTQNNGGHASNLQLVQIVKAKTQVVSGQKLFLTLKLTSDYYCDVTVWYQSWNATGNRCTVTDGPTCSRKPATRQLLAGGVSTEHSIDENTEDSIMNALNFAACSYNARSNAMFNFMITDSSKITYTKQVVAGMKYQFRNVPMGETLCQKQGACDHANLLANCQANTKGMTETCSFTVVWASWQTPQYTLTNMQCH